jgi:hypothetical protein
MINIDGAVQGIEYFGPVFFAQIICPDFIRVKGYREMSPAVCITVGEDPGIVTGFGKRLRGQIFA